MSWTRRFIWTFWLFVGIMLLWQFYLYNQKLSTPDPAHPEQDHYYFYQPDLNPKTAPRAVHDGPYVEQTAFSVSNDTPSSVSFTCHITLKNSGKGKAVNVQARVRPYRGTIQGDVDMGHTKIVPIDENSMLSQFGKYVGFPDLAPGASATEDVVFMKQAGGNPGTNPSPEIIYEAEKK